jgi:alkylation response protein AidB-like acyl-CoA dehydrogenase
MQIDMEDVLALSDSVDKLLAAYPAGVASLQALKQPGVLREQTEAQLAELGVRYLFNPVASGGVDLRAQTVLAQCFGRHLFHGASLFQDVIGAYVVSQLGQLPQGLSAQALADGEWSLTVALDNDPMGNVVQAQANAQGGWVLQGIVPVVPYAQASTHVLLAVQMASTSTQRYALLPLNAAGVQAQHSSALDGCALSALQLRDVELPEDALLDGAQVAQALAQGQRHATLLICFEAVGLMEQVLKKTTEYLQIRKQFGKAIGTFQALQHRMVGILLLLEQTRSAADLALEAMLAGAPDQQMRLSAAKYAVGVNGQKVAEECVQLHGGIGMTWELDTAHYAKRLLMLDHYFDNADQSLSQVMAAL